MNAKMNAKTAKRLSKRKSKGVSLNGGGMTMSIIELMHHIVREPAPGLTPEGRFPKEAEDFVDACLLKDPDERQTPKMLLVSLLISHSIGNPGSTHSICRPPRGWIWLGPLLSI